MRYEITCTYTNSLTGHYGTESFETDCDEGLMIKIIRGLYKTGCSDISAQTSNGETYRIDAWSGEIEKM